MKSCEDEFSLVYAFSLVSAVRYRSLHTIVKVEFSAREERQKLRSDVAGRRDNAGWMDGWVTSVEDRQREISSDEPLQLMEGRNFLSR